MCLPGRRRAGLMATRSLESTVAYSQSQTVTAHPGPVPKASVPIQTLACCTLLSPLRAPESRSPLDPARQPLSPLGPPAQHRYHVHTTTLPAPVCRY